MRKLAGKLIGTSSERWAKKMGHVLTVNQITKGDNNAKITQEHEGKHLIIVLSYKSNIYELQAQA